ncbi:MAG: fatty acid desaturase [Anaerolineae bacterium]|nr:fatty acid desaturase [Anaerolineae bacterium]
MSQFEQFTVPARAVWKEAVARYHNPAMWRSTWQLVNSIVPYIALWVGMYFSLRVSYLLTLVLALVAGGFLTRIFIIFHDCGHGAFFKSRQANDFWGILTGVLTFTPYYEWRHEHAIHHAGSSNLERRGVGDVWTLTVDEYLALSRFDRIKYRVYRHPLFLFTVAPVFTFLVLKRFPIPQSKGARERGSIRFTNIALLLVAVILSLVLGWKEYLLIQLPVIGFASIMGVWLFYVQHQFEGTYWEHNAKWDYVTAALKGSSFYKLPKVLQWFSGNIGLHHIHHLSPRIPNYYLQKCFNENPIFQQIQPVTFWRSFKSATYRLWDEQTARLVSFRELKHLLRAREQRQMPSA